MLSATTITVLGLWLIEPAIHSAMVAAEPPACETPAPRPCERLRKIKAGINRVISRQRLLVESLFEGVAECCQGVYFLFKHQLREGETCGQCLSFADGVWNVRQHIRRGTFKNVSTQLVEHVLCGQPFALGVLGKLQ